MSITKERKEFEQKFQPLYNYFHAKNSAFKEKEAIFYNQNRISIFRGDDLLKFIWNNKVLILALYPKLEEEITIQEEKDSVLVAESLLDNQIIMRLERHPDDTVKRWPKKLILTKDQSMTGDSFYTWNMQSRNGMTNAKMMMVLMVIFSVFLYPIWPFELKYAIFKVTLYVSIVLLSLMIGRIVLFLLVRLTGTSFWVFPNLDDENLGVWESFKPLYSCKRQSDGRLQITLRLLGLIGLASLIHGVVQEPAIIDGIGCINMRDLSSAGGQTVDDILQWGKVKLEGKVEPLYKRAIPDLSQILRDAEETPNLEEEIRANQF